MKRISCKLVFITKTPFIFKSRRTTSQFNIVVNNSNHAFHTPTVTWTNTGRGRHRRLGGSDWSIRKIAGELLVREMDALFILNLWRSMHISSATEVTRHRASTSMYSLTFRVRVTKPPQYGRNGTASLPIASRTQQARRFYRWRGESSPACVVRAACGGPGGLPLSCATHF